VGGVSVAENRPRESGVTGNHESALPRRRRQNATGRARDAQAPPATRCAGFKRGWCARGNGARRLTPRPPRQSASSRPSTRLIRVCSLWLPLRVDTAKRGEQNPQSADKKRVARGAHTPKKPWITPAMASATPQWRRQPSTDSGFSSRLMRRVWPKRRRSASGIYYPRLPRLNQPRYHRRRP